MERTPQRLNEVFENPVLMRTTLLKELVAVLEMLLPGSLMPEDSNVVRLLGRILKFIANPKKELHGNLQVVAWTYSFDTLPVARSACSRTSTPLAWLWGAAARGCLFNLAFQRLSRSQDVQKNSQLN